MTTENTCKVCRANQANSGQLVAISAVYAKLLWTYMYMYMYHRQTQVHVVVVSKYIMHLLRLNYHLIQSQHYMQS